MLTITKLTVGRSILGSLKFSFCGATIVGSAVSRGSTWLSALLWLWFSTMMGRFKPLGGWNSGRLMLDTSRAGAMKPSTRLCRPRMTCSCRRSSGTCRHQRDDSAGDTASEAAVVAAR